MRVSRKIRFALLTASASTAALAFSGPALAQDSTGEEDEDVIVVSGIRASIEASLEAKRNSDMVSEVVTAQDIGKFPDKNVADSLGRLTGVNVVTGSAAAGGFGENSNISIRGTDPSLNLTLYDGHAIATGDWFVLDQTAGGRSFDFALLPSEVVGSLEVFKSSQADLVEGGVGGTVNVHSRRPFDLDAGALSLTAQANYNDLADKLRPQMSGLFSWKNEDETFGILATGFYQERSFRRDGQEFLGYGSYEDFDGTGQTVAAPNLIGAAYFTQERERKGGTLAVQFAPSDQLEVTLNGLFSRMDADNVNRNSMAWISRLMGNNSTPGTDGYALSSYTVRDGYLVEASWDDLAADGSPVSGRVQDDIFREAFSQTWDVNGEVRFEASDRLTLYGHVGYTEGKGETSDTYAWETYWNTGVDYRIDGKGAFVTYPALPQDTTSAEYLDNFYSWSWGGKISAPDKEFYGKLDAEYELDGSFLRAIKAGVRFTDHDHSLIYDAYAWPGNGLYSGNQGVNLDTVYAGEGTPSNYGDGIGYVDGYSFADRELVLEALDTAGGRTFAFYPQASFAMTEKTQALYAMARFDNDSGWRGNIGVRAVHTDLEATQYSPNAPVANATSIFCATCGTVETDNDYWDILPSLNVNYELSDDVLLRGGVAKVMSRPGYAQLAGAFTANDLALTATAGGNPDLDPFRAWTLSPQNAAR